MRRLVIDCRHIHSEADFWQRYLLLPELLGAGYFGRNLDALWDAFAGGPGYPGPCELHLVNTTSIKSLSGGHFYQALREIARDLELAGRDDVKLVVD